MNFTIFLKLLVLLVSSIVTTTTTTRRGWAIATPTIVTPTSTVGVWWIGRVTSVTTASWRRGTVSVWVVRGRRGWAIGRVRRTTRVAIVRRWTAVKERERKREREKKRERKRGEAK